MTSLARSLKLATTSTSSLEPRRVTVAKIGHSRSGPTNFFVDKPRDVPSFRTRAGKSFLVHFWRKDFGGEGEKIVR